MSATKSSLTCLVFLCVCCCSQATPRQTPVVPWLQHDRGQSFSASRAPPRQDPRGANRILGQWHKQTPWRPPLARPPRLPPPPPPPFGNNLRPQPRIGHRLGPNPRNALPRPPMQRTPQDAPLVAPLPREVMDVLPGAISRVMSSYRRASSSTTTTTEPPVIWFPNQNEECEQDSGGGGFSAFSLLALVMSATNLVGILASNANNNLNNNNNNDNINNNNVQDSNENNANNNGNVFTMVTFGAGRKRSRRRRRGVEGEVEGEVEEDDKSVCWTSEVEFLSPEEVSAVVALEFLRAYLHAGLTRDPGCLSRSLCRANAASAEWGDLAHALAHALSTAHAEWVSQAIPVGVTSSSMLRAAARGRSASDPRACDRLYRCPEALWRQLTDDGAVMQRFVHLAHQATVAWA
ncbi:ras guanine nucleotide exchange factor P-like [Penaeus japonicus]|uniref:ras guanine nucleotide exchange factor P-like n=1 Tax=Penaeus japonicus TaxID=27405 RepID=UPI001C7168CF|nr:ras guanine nucleotide exchange factor P-like [Penaeus japonicus]